MEFSTSRVLVFVSLACLLSEVTASNCTKGEFSCFTCMGRDSENCRSGNTCCKGACFKLEDIKHNVIVKGCVATKEEDASMKVRELNVPLYWANNEKVKGESFFCSGKAFCNSSNGYTILLTIISAFFALKVIN